MSTIAAQEEVGAAGWTVPACGAGVSTHRTCFHCGEPCEDSGFSKAGQSFCCQGCRIVHDLLIESGLDHFYELSRHPGVRVRHQARAERWLFLDEPSVQQRLLDFTDGRQSRVTFQIPAIHCVACVWLLENLFQLHPGIGCSRVNFPKREVAVSFTPKDIKPSELVALLAAIGYEPSLTLDELEKQKPNPARKRLWMQVGIAGFAFGNIMLFSLPAYFGLDSFSGPIFKTLFGGLSLAIALPVLVFSASDYWKSALLSLRRRAPTLDVPIAVGLVALYGQSAFEILAQRGEGYLDSLAGLVFFLLCGRAFQHKTYERLAFDRDYKSFFPLSVTRKTCPLRGSQHEGLLPKSSEPEQVGRVTPCAPSLPQENGEFCGLDSGRGAHGVTRPTITPPGQNAREEAATTGFEEEHVSLSQLQVGDRIVIRNGELIPADAKLVSGEAFVDYSFVTGESEPVAKQEGDYLYAGGKQIGGAIEVETLKPVSQSYLASLWNHETFQQDCDDVFNTLTNRVGRFFTLAVIVVATGAALWWIASGNMPRAIKAFISVLIVACPCALALAAPFTFGTAQRLLERLGAFLKNSSILERLARVDSIVFDKTGTLTEAGAGTVRFEVTQQPCSLAPGLSRVSNGGVAAGTVSTVSVPSLETDKSVAGPSSSDNTGLKPSANEKLNEREERWIFLLTGHSTHPHSARINEALIAEARRTSNVQHPTSNIQFSGDAAAAAVQSFRETPGCGIEGKIAGHEILLGSQAWLESRGVEVAQASLPAGSGGILPPCEAGSFATRRLEARATSGSTVHVAIDGRHRGAFILQGALRPETHRLIRRLAERYDVTLLSGDNERECERFQSLFGGSERLHFNQSPLDKLGFIRGLQQSGRTVMMVGDGLNDAGALKQSDVGVAVVEGIGAFSPACDVILDGRQVGCLPEILAFARRSTRIVRLAFGISVLYNLVGISIAAAGILSPLISAILMPLSSLSVVLFACGGATYIGRNLHAPIPLTAEAGIPQPEPQPDH